MKTYRLGLGAVLLSTVLSSCASKTERQFASICEINGIDTSICKCVYDRLEDKYGEDRLKRNLFTPSPSQADQFEHDIVNNSIQCTRE